MDSTSSRGRDSPPGADETALPGVESAIDELPVSHVREGMDVVDAEGKKIGEVDMVRLGDPEAVTLAGQEEAGARGGMIDAMLGVFGDRPDVPETIRNRLIHDGFIRIDGGLFGPTRYALADQVAGVVGDTVRLNARKDDLIKPE
jgi:hypothetical protein